MNVVLINDETFFNNSYNIFLIIVNKKYKILEGFHP